MDSPVWAPHTWEPQTHISGIDGLASRLDIILSFHQAHKLAFQQENFTSCLLDTAFWETSELFPPVRGRKTDIISSVVASSVQREAKNCLTSVTAYTSVAFWA